MISSACLFELGAQHFGTLSEQLFIQWLRSEKKRLVPMIPSEHTTSSDSLLKVSMTCEQPSPKEQDLTL